jgi:hypothetical protein
MHNPEFDTFEGYLESHEMHGTGVELRFLAGGFDPAPSSPPVLRVVAQNVEGLPELQLCLQKLAQHDDFLHIESVSSTEVVIHSDHEEPLRICGSSLAVTLEPYSARDFERLARINYQWGSSQSAALTKALARINEADRLASEQTRRLNAKREGHALGSTARTLYDQHLAFIERLIETLRK